MAPNSRKSIFASLTALLLLNISCVFGQESSWQIRPRGTEINHLLFQETAGLPNPDYVLKTCEEVPSGDQITEMNTINPASWLVSQVLYESGRKVPYGEFKALIASVELTQLQPVSNGELTPNTESIGGKGYTYLPKTIFVGKDQTIFMGEFEGKYYKIVANIVVTDSYNENDPKCPEPELIKVPKPLAEAFRDHLASSPVQ